MVGIYVPPYARDVKSGPIFDSDGEMFLVALRDVKVGECAADAFVRPDFGRPEIGEGGTRAALFWSGLLEFHQ